MKIFLKFLFNTILISIIPAAHHFHVQLSGLLHQVRLQPLLRPGGQHDQALPRLHQRARLQRLQTRPDRVHRPHGRARQIHRQGQVLRPPHPGVPAVPAECAESGPGPGDQVC